MKNQIPIHLLETEISLEKNKKVKLSEYISDKEVFTFTSNDKIPSTHLILCRHNASVFTVLKIQNP